MSGAIKQGNKTAQMQAKFAAEYLIDFNGKQAAIRAGYSARSAAQIASRLLTRDNVQKILTTAIAARNEIAAGSSDAALDMVKAVAEADPNALVEMRRGCCRFCHGDDGQYQYTREEFRAVKEQHAADMAAYLRGAGSKPNAEPYPPLDVKGGIGFNPNNKPNPECTECFGEGEVRTFVKDTRELTDAERRLFAGIKETQHGIELKVNSQDKARELLMRHHGLLVDRVGNPDGSAFAGGTPAPMIVTFVDVVQAAPGESDGGKKAP